MMIHAPLPEEHGVTLTTMHCTVYVIEVFNKDGTRSRALFLDRQQAMSVAERLREKRAAEELINEEELIV